MAKGDPDWNDPCAVLAWLTPQYYRVVAGRQVVEIRHGDTTTSYGQANLDKLNALMQRLTADCAAKNPQTKKRRRAFTAG
jgi:hypothetical protein